MPHDTALIATIAAGFGLAFVLGLVATRLRLPPLVGYLVAGIVVGPYTPGFVGDTALAGQLAEIGVILLMFGVGVHFSIGDLLAVRRIAIPGAVAQIILATALGAGVAHFWGWSWGAGLVFGLSLSVASTVVLLRALEARGSLDTGDGRIAVGWLVVEDLVTVLALVLLPAFALSLGGTPVEGGDHAVAQPSVVGALGLTLVKVGAFLALMLFVGTRAVPWLLERVARTGSRELFTLAVLAVAVGVAVGAASLFGVSFALGAFFAGVVIAESDLSHQAAADALPLQDAFAVLFFVSVGMLFDPTILIRQPLHVLGTVLIIMVGKSLAAFAVVLLFRYPVRTALLISASLAQIGEFSFILAGLGIALGLLPEDARSLVLAGALLSITLNPITFAGAGPIERWIKRRPRLLEFLERTDVIPVAPAEEAFLRDHVVLIGYGRVGSIIGEALAHHGIPFAVVERDRMLVEALRKRGVHAIYGDAARPMIFAHTHPETARLLIVAAPDPYHARRIVELARQVNPAIETVVRTHSDAERRYLERIGVGRALMGERELAFGIAHYALVNLGRTDDEADATIDAIRQRDRSRDKPAKEPPEPVPA
ncbi:MAG TPA: YbaL family putative K(+) efflux transporter [Gemmatimonadaceae bacterium]